MKTVYQTDDNGFFVGSVHADPSPLENDVWLIPAGAVETAPPAVEDGQRAKWAGDAWVVVDPEPPLEPEPEPTQEELAAVIRTERDAILSRFDWTQVADAPVDQAAWAAYRQALRDVPQQAGFPHDVVWPEQP